MAIQYDSETDMLYIKLCGGISVQSDEVASQIVFDYDESNRVIGIEIEDASLHMDLSKLEISALPLLDLVIRQPQVFAAAV